MKLKLFCFFLFTLTIFSEISSQEKLFSIKGFVFDEEQQAIEFVNVFEKNQQVGTISNKNGSFSLHINEAFSDTLEISFSYVGFETQILKSSTKELKTPLYIYLKNSATKLDDFVIKELKKQTSSSELLDISFFKNTLGGSGNI